MTIRVFAALLDFAKDVIWTILRDLYVHARITHDSLCKRGCDRFFELPRGGTRGLDMAREWNRNLTAIVDFILAGDVGLAVDLQPDPVVGAEDVTFRGRCGWRRLC